ncbi:MAG: hypothetical protein J0L64_18245 [Acidobacteria bacterium]|nr:hypothetical protein [Acidobacteriota bacterium]
MQSATVVASRQGEMRLLEVALPGRRPEPCGILLLDPATPQFGLRLRRDWDALTQDDDDLDVLESLEDDLRQKAAELGPAAFLAHLDDSLSNTLRVSEPQTVLLGSFASTLNRLYERHVPATVRAFETHLPLWSVRAAAGGYSERQTAEIEQWIEVPPGTRMSQDLFAAHVIGASMEPRIPSGSLCLFRKFGAGSRNGKLVLVEDQSEPESGERYTIKRYRSEKSITDEGDWQHEAIWMEPLNPAFEPWQLTEDKPARVVGEFLAVLD